MNTGRERLPSLDGWRAISIILVMVSHFPYAQGGKFLAAIPIIFDQGDFGVRVFFVISGFLITYLLIAEQRRNGAVSLRRFYIRRTLRIWPVYFAYVFLLVLLLAAGLYSDTLSSWIGVFTFTRNVVGVGDSATGHFWSLAVEEQFYLVVPLLFAGAGLYTSPRRGIALLAIAVFTPIVVRYVNCSTYDFMCARIFGARSLLRYGDNLAIGGFFAFLYAHGRVEGLGRKWVFWSSLLGLVALRTGLINLGGASFAQPTLEAGLAGICIVGSIVMKTGRSVAVLNSGATKYVGKRSYSLYVWHFLFISQFLKLENPPLIFNWKFWWIPAIATGLMSYRFIEQPLVHLRAKYR